MVDSLGVAILAGAGGMTYLSTMINEQYTCSYSYKLGHLTCSDMPDFSETRCYKVTCKYVNAMTKGGLSHVIVSSVLAAAFLAGSICVFYYAVCKRCGEIKRPKQFTCSKSEVHNILNQVDHFPFLRNCTPWKQAIQN